MVDRANIGKNLCVETVNPSVPRGKDSSRKRRRPVAGPQLQDGIAYLLLEEASNIVIVKRRLKVTRVKLNLSVWRKNKNLMNLRC